MEPLFKFHFWQTVSVLCLKSFFPPRWLTIKFGVPSFETDISSFLIQLSPQQPPQIPTSVTSVRNKNFNCCDPTCPFVHLKHSASCKNRVCKHPKKTDVHLFPIDSPSHGFRFCCWNHMEITIIISKSKWRPAKVKVELSVLPGPAASGVTTVGWNHIFRPSGRCLNVFNIF